MARRFLGAVPPVTLRIMIATAVITIAAVLGESALPQFVAALVFRPIDVLQRFEVWKVVSYAFFTGSDPISFLFDLLVFYFFGGWFERSFGSRRFTGFFFLSAVGATALPLVLGLVSPHVAECPYFGAWPVFEALTVAMGMLQPTAQVYFYMLFPVTARQLMFLSWALIGLFVIFAHSFVPYLAAIGGIGMGFVLSMGASGPRRWWLRLQAARLDRQLKRRAQHLRVVPRNGEDKKDHYLH